MDTCLLIHGFTGSPHEVKPLANYLESQGYEVVTPTLAGHGGTRAQMRQANWQDWITSAEAVLKDLLLQGKTVHIAGFSMGGLIAAYLAGKYSVRSLTMLSTPIFYLNKRQMLRTFQNSIKKKLARKTVTAGEGASGDIASLVEASPTVNRYKLKMRITPLSAVWNFRQLVRELKPFLKGVSVPVLIIQGEKDDLVEPRSGWYIYHAVVSEVKGIHFFPDSDHMICLGIDQQQVNQIVSDFISSHSG